MPEEQQKMEAKGIELSLYYWEKMKNWWAIPDETYSIPPGNQQQQIFWNQAAGRNSLHSNTSSPA